MDQAAIYQAGFVARLHAVLSLTDAAGIHVILDNHDNMVGTAGCGNCKVSLCCLGVATPSSKLGRGKP